MTTKFADIIVPLPLAQTYTYSIPEDMENQIAVGMRVIVHFGTSKFYTGIVANIHSNHPAYDKIKPISEIIDDKPILLPSQLQLWNFVSQYYQSALGDVYKTALPSGLKIENESIIELVPEILESYDSKFSKSEQKIIDTLSDEKSHSITEFTTSQLKHIKHLIDIGIIAKTEKTTDNYKPKFTDFIVINPIYKDNADKALQIIGKAKKQCELFEQYVALSNYSTISRQQLLEQTKISASILKQLIEKGILQIEKRRCYRIDTTSEISSATHQLTPVQQTAYEEIKSGFATHQSILLHGITSSGKTEIYIQLIKDCISKGKQVLMLVPEAGLTQQLANRLKQFFGGEMGIFHSFCSSYERVETYQHQLSDNPYKLILGVRSSIFLPFKNLGLIIIDEEHDMGYKQIEPSPRYHARDVATLLARIHNAKTLLGSATPSIETYANCYNGKYKLVELNERYGGVSLPEIKLIDIKECYRKKQMKGHFSLEMIETIKHCIEAGEQVILFQNRRGFAPYIKCAQCGYVPKCPNCDVSLTYHRHNNTLTCHYCGHTVPINNHESPTTFNTQLSSISSFCPQCKEGQLSTHGFGTEQVEDEVRVLFPDYRVARLDLDTSRSAKAFDSIIGAFQNGEIDILIGTQMVAKGLDFDNVGLVGILNADNLLYHPDFRAYERAYQLLVQVSGRTGRRSEQGKVIIQTYQPENPIFNQIKMNDYRGFFNQDMTERHAFNYPPYVRLIRIIIKHTDFDICNRAADMLANKLKLRLKNRILGPDIPAIGRIQNKHIKQILVKIEISAPIHQAKQILHDEIQGVMSQRPYNTVQFQLDVDPI
jgi:primosomal protein N' (replication factor Y)